MKKLNIKNKQAGVTLIELVLSIIILSVIVISMSNFMSSSTKAYNVVQSSTENHNQLSYAMGRMGNEIKSVDYVNPNFVINNNYSASKFEFDNTDGVTVILEYTLGVLSLSYSTVAGGTAYTLADSVTSFSFDYFKSNGVDPPADVTEIQFIEFDLTITDDGVNYHSKSRVGLRNL